MSSERAGLDVGIRPQTRLEIRLLGTVTVTLGGQRLRAFDSVRLQRFLALIVLLGGPLQRFRLAYQLWPDSDEAQARTNLRKLLHEFRHALPGISEYVEIDNHVICWTSSPTAWVDVVRFREAIESGELEMAGRIYGGDLLPACYDDWSLQQRSRLREQAHMTFRHLAECAAEDGNHAAAIEQAGRALEIFPADEGAALFLMNSHLASDDRAGAIRAYRRFADTFKRDLGATPGPEISQTYRRMLGSTPSRSN